MARNSRDFTYDNATLLKDAGAVAADAAGTVLAAVKVVTLGAGRADARMIVDVSAIVVGADNRYDIQLQFSNSPTFASGVIGGASLSLGNAAVLPGESATSVIGRYEAAFTNEINGTLYSYCRVYTNVSGTTPSINYTAYLVTR
ncbi:MAG TPA: hypothetical protein VNK51_05525 [Bradyrhizobium sp.]|nr:hypothetical protein [Bradyrhizobium sp.]